MVERMSRKGNPPINGYVNWYNCCGLPCPPPGDIPIQGSNPGLPHCRWILYCLSHQGIRVHDWKKCYLHILSPTIVWYVSENMTHKALESSGKIYRFMSFIFQYRIYSLKNRDWHHSYLNSWQKSIDLLIRGGQVKKLQCKNPSQK